MRHSSHASMWWPYGCKHPKQTLRLQIAQTAASTSAVGLPQEAQAGCDGVLAAGFGASVGTAAL